MATVEPSASIDGVVRVHLDVHEDERGRFVETFRREWIPGVREMVQANRGDRMANCLVGLHYHRFQADYWYVPFGRAQVVLHDLREGSPTDGATESFQIGAGAGDGDHVGVYIPPGVAHGFASLTDMSISYLVDGYYDPDDELGVAWDDPEIGADWGLTADPVISARDQANPRRRDLDPALRPAHAGSRR